MRVSCSDTVNEQADRTLQRWPGAYLLPVHRDRGTVTFTVLMTIMSRRAEPSNDGGGGVDMTSGVVCSVLPKTSAMRS